MSILLSRIKVYGLAIVAAVAGVLAVIVRLLFAQNSRLSRRAENAEEKARRAVIIAEADKDISEAKRKLRDKQKSTNHPGFNDPNKLWKSNDDT